jgi:DNA-binding beta-propeller fold protein YncE
VSKLSTTGVGRLLLIGLLSAVGCEEFQGVPAPTDAMHFPVGLVLHPDGRYLYVINSNFNVAFREDLGGTVTVIDTDTLELVEESTVLMGSFGGHAVLTSDAQHLYIAVRGDNSVVRLDVSEDGRTITCLGENDARPCRIQGLSADPYALAIDSFETNLEVGGDTHIDLIVVTHLNSNAITAFSIKERDLTTVVRVRSDLISGGSGIAVNPRTGIFYVSGRFSEHVRSFLPQVGREGDVSGIFALNEITLVNPFGTYDARDIVFAHGGNRAFVSAHSPSSVLVIDTSPLNRDTGRGTRDEVIAQVDLEDAPESMWVLDEPDGENLYVAEFEGDHITVIDTDSFAILDRFPVGNGPADLVADTERHQRIYVSLFLEAAVGVIDIDPESRRYRTLIAKIR